MTEASRGDPWMFPHRRSTRAEIPEHRPAAVYNHAPAVYNHAPEHQTLGGWGCKAHTVTGVLKEARSVPLGGAHTISDILPKN